MNARQVLTVGASILAFSLSGACARSQQVQGRVVRLAELEIDPVQPDTSIRVEPGVLTLSAVALRDNSAHIRIFEVYAAAAA